VDDAIRTTAGAADTAADLGDAFGSPRCGPADHRRLHPALAGQKAIARRFVERLAGSSQPRVPVNFTQSVEHSRHGRYTKMER
jgi:hypothetical protein